MDIHKVEPLPELVARAEKEREELDYGVVRPFVIELANRGRVRAEEWAVAMNSYERELLVPHLETEVFLQQVQHCLLNCERKDVPSYDAALQNRYAPDALRRIRELGELLVTTQTRWEDVCERQEELAGKLDVIRQEARRLTAVLTFVINWCQDKPEDANPGPFRRDTYQDGLRYAKRTILTRVLGRIEPGAAETECLGCGACGREKHLAGCPTVGEEVTDG